VPRYMVERTFPAGLQIPITDDGVKACLGVVHLNAELGVTWVHSYSSDDKRRRFCVHDAWTKNRSAARRHATRCQSIRSRLSACSTRTSTADRGAAAR
jgi:hypothetical protein